MIRSHTAPVSRRSKSSRRPSARQLACEILTAAEREEQYLDQILEKRLSHAALSVADRALVTALAHGVMRMRGRLDFEIGGHFHKDYASAPPLLKNILRTALFQMRFMDRIPAYAAIHEAVALARVRFGENLARLCNAVLRQAQRSPYVALPFAKLFAEKNISEWAQDLSYPSWLLGRWLDQRGAEETLALAQAFNEIPDITLRLVRPAQNTQSVLQELEKLEISYEPVAGVPDTYRLAHCDGIAALQAFQQGACTVQDASTCLVAHLAAPMLHDTVIDLCAAPGGKALHLAELVQEKVMAVDLSPKRLRLLQESAQRLRLNLHTIASDARNFSTAPADLVVVDAPCSGLGVLGRRSDLRWRRQPEDIPQLVQLQKEILTNAARLVKTGGRLLYSTCTLAPEENEEIAAWFLEQHAQFRLQPAADFVAAEFCDDNGFVQTLPHRHHMDGSFAARFLKEG